MKCLDPCVNWCGHILLSLIHIGTVYSNDSDILLCYALKLWMHSAQYCHTCNREGISFNRASEQVSVVRYPIYVKLFKLLMHNVSHIVEDFNSAYACG